MADVDRSREVNRRHWDERAPAHAASADYSFDRFVDDPGYLSDVVRFDLPRLGDIAGLRGVHLQCHIGTDTISLARLGARMTGLDFSAASLEEARLLARATHADVDFVQAEVTDATSVLEPGAFDLVYTGIGALCWLPDIRRWAGVVAALLRPGGRLFIREGHPVLWALDYARTDGELVLVYPYRETVEPVIDISEGSYVEVEETLLNVESHSWNHGLGEIVSALLDEGLVLTQLVEHESVPWNPLPGGGMRLVEAGEWRLIDRPERLPLTYTLQASKPLAG
jgi:2-polyprenyl-3-methyl-5-hydroxy-6-metoxy-1,4-benzoquinol methylase